MLLQDFSTPAGDDDQIEFDLSDVNLTGSIVYWNVYEQDYGVPTGSPIIAKNSHDGSITIIESPGNVFMVSLDGHDTIALLGNYYHVAQVIDVLGDQTTVTYGTMCVTQGGVV